MRDILIDMRRIRSVDDYPYLVKKLDAPNWFGNNLDALFDILGDMPQANITLRYTESIQKGTFPYNVLSVFKAAAEENSRINLILS